jgi:hypothetical protein
MIHHIPHVAKLTVHVDHRFIGMPDIPDRGTGGVGIMSEPPTHLLHPPLDRALCHGNQIGASEVVCDLSERYFLCPEIDRSYDDP